YSWVEIGKSELHTLGLNNEARTSEDPRHSGNWRAAAAVRASGNVLEVRMNGLQVGAPPGNYNTLLYSRKITNPSRLSKKDQEDGKLYEYFLLTRDAEPGKEITGEYLTSAKEGGDRSGALAVDFHFNAKGGALFYEITSANVEQGSDEGNRRSLAIVLDGLIMSAPSLITAIRDSGQITGRFTKAEVDNLVNILRSGALPATLKPQPV